VRIYHNYVDDVETIVFNGITFRRYPSAKQSSHRDYFSPHAGHRRQGVGCLHQEIWKAEHGPIPTGCHIHHLDGNPLNNDLANLVCLTSSEHRRAHRQPASDRRREHLESIRPLTKVWHQSEAGRAWHRQHAAEAWKSREPVPHRCQQCGEEYLAFHDAARFCSRNCIMAARRQSGVDDEIRNCTACGHEFRINRYRHTQVCSRTCGWMLRRKRAA
jgi:hypothetical protein